MSERALEGWLLELRQRYVALARRRVTDDAVEDVVQDALRVVIERGLEGPGGSLVDGLPPLAWCFQVLRHTIGNHYQKRRVRRARWSPAEGAATAADPRRTPLEACEAAEAERLVRECLGRMSERDAECAGMLARIAEGEAPGAVARSKGVEQAAFYRRLYRCREKLRALLAERGVEA